MTVHQFPPTGRFEAVLAAAKRQLPEPVQPAEPSPRYVLHASLDGYEIAEFGSVIARIEGPNFALAGRLLRLLREDAERGPEPRGIA